MKRILFFVVCITMLSCKKESAAEHTFQSCDLKSNNIQTLINQSGTLSYTNKISSFQLSKFSYFINLSGQLPLEVCNMPSSVKLAENEVKNVSFSGEMVVLSPNTDAISTTIQLSGLKIK